MPSAPISISASTAVALIYLSYAAANRDPEVFVDPHHFDIAWAKAKRHLAFGTGQYICVAAGLQRCNCAQIILRLSDIHPVGDPDANDPHPGTISPRITTATRLG
jgi:cytochrome P450